MKKAHSFASFLFQRSALCVALSLSIFGSAQALTLNRPVVQSKQGEALRAEIDISEITVAEQIELQANLASQDIYKAAQIEWPTSNGAPLEIQVQLWRRDNGKPFLKISSQQPVTRNSIDLLIDLRGQRVAYCATSICHWMTTKSSPLSLLPHQLWRVARHRLHRANKSVCNVATRPVSWRWASYLLACP